MEVTTEFKMVPVKDIQADPNQPRKFFDETALGELTIIETSKDFEVTFKWDQSKLAMVKEIPGSWFHGPTKTWHVPKRRLNEVVKMGKYFGVTGLPDVEEEIPEQVGEIPPMPELDVPLELKLNPFPYQLQGIAYNRIHKRTIIGDKPGLGKTLQLIGTICSYGYNGNHLTLGPGLIICPSTLKLNWQQEWLKVAGIRAMILSDKVKKTWMQFYHKGMADVFICNYESLKKYFVQEGWVKPKENFRLNGIPFQDTINLFNWVAIDESHKCKDGTTQQTKFVLGITRGKEHVYTLTGTPVINKPKDLISQLAIINRLQEIVSHIPQPRDKKTNLPKDASGYTRFINRYCDGGNGESHLQELHYRLKTTCYYMREKKEVLKDLPDKTRQVVLVEITNRQEYEHAKKNFKDYLRSVKGCSDQEVRKKLRGQMMVKMGVLRQIAAKGKISAVKNYIDDILESGEKFGLFFNLKEIVHEFQDIYKNALTIYGENTLTERDQAVKAFQNNPAANLILLNLLSGGVGLTLTAASIMGFIEFPWTAALCEQAEDRFHRIGQKDNVQCLYFLAKNTIDEYCYYEVIQKKKDLAKTVTGSNEDIEEQLIDDLLNLFSRSYAEA